MSTLLFSALRDRQNAKLEKGLDAGVLSGDVTMSRFFPAARNGTRSARFAALVLLAALPAASAAAAANPAPDSKLAPQAPPASESMAVSVIKAKNACFLDALQLSGLIVPREEVLVRPEWEGLLVTALLAEDGASVNAGQPLAQLARPDWLPGTPAKATLTSPAKGTLLYRQLAVGMPASARGEPLFRIVRDGELELLVGLPRDALPKIKPEQTVRIEMLDSSQTAGTVRIILPEIDPMTQIGHARIQIRGATSARPGAFATASIDLGQSCGASVPLSAVLYGPQGAIVQVVRDNKIETRRVNVGLFQGLDAQITDGLAAGDVVVVRAGSFLREGDLVRPMP
ncbi:RND family efflux transporter, MFP subunit [Methylocapsa palsarum]|uniref:RND family efflux transporter, MFP subunit n=2 Tax=Methylocapsa palsarum TaxID=1612308 RepID=A0A1I3XJ11_9HYPH|nr:RND family efflux transporter, MFP subunit [Methylocapsa palsarum]